MTHTLSEINAYVNGVVAFNKDQSIDENPHAVDTDLFWAWEEGYLDIRSVANYDIEVDQMAIQLPDPYAKEIQLRIAV